LGVHITTVSGWSSFRRKHGEAKFVADARSDGKGRPPKLSEDEQDRLRRLVNTTSPEDNGLDYPLWTRAAVSELCAKLLGKTIIIRTINNYLKRWGFTPQVPVRRAREQDPVAVRRWRDEEYPAIEGKAAEEGAPILWCDETGVSTQANVCRGYAPKGWTPELTATAKRHTRSVISAISNKGDMRWMVYKGGIKVPLLINFLTRLVKSMNGRKVHLIWDNLRVHHGKEVKLWLSTREKEIEVHYLPPYSPQLQPDERLNRALKGDLSRLPVPRDTAIGRGLPSAPC
jgi:transposase